MERENLSKNITRLSCVTASTARGDVEDTEKDICSAGLVMQQVLLGSASLWEILLTVKICLEKQIMCCSLPRKRLTAVPFGEVKYFCIFSVDLVKGVLKTS